MKAWATGDRALLLSIFAEDALWADPADTPPFRGLDGVAKFWDFAHQGADRQVTPVIQEIRANGSEGVLRFIMQVRIPSKNQGLDLSVIDYFQLNDAGKIKVAKAFWDASSASVPAGMELFAPNIDEAYES
jgi:steroid delta-isomerase